MRKNIQTILSQLSDLRRSRKLRFINEDTQKKSNKISGRIYRYWRIENHILTILAKISCREIVNEVFIYDARHPNHRIVVSFDQSGDTVLLDDSVFVNWNDDSAFSLVLKSAKASHSATLSHWMKKDPALMPIDKQYKIALHLEDLTPKQIDYGRNNEIFFSIIIPIYQPDPDYLADCLNSILTQNYQGKIETIVTIDEIDKKGNKILNDFSSKLNIIQNKNEDRLHISANLNGGLEMATGTYCLFLDQDDMLHEEALSTFYETLSSQQFDVVYSDEDKINEEGVRIRPLYKPDFDIFYLRSTNYINHLVAVRRKLGEELGWFRARVEGAQDHDLLLRLCNAGAKFKHIPEILYHWRMIAGSTAESFDNKAYAAQAAMSAIDLHLQFHGFGAETTPGRFKGIYDWMPSLQDEISVTILRTSTRVDEDVERIRSIIDKTSYGDYEILQFVAVDQLEVYEQQFKGASNIRFFATVEPERLTQSLLREVLGSNTSQLIGLLHGNTTPDNGDWIARAVRCFQMPDIGVVGSKIMDENDKLVHAGQVVSSSGFTVMNLMRGMRDSDPGYFRKDAIRQVSSVDENGMFLNRALVAAKLNKHETSQGQKLSRLIRMLDDLTILYNPFTILRLDHRHDDQESVIDSINLKAPEHSPTIHVDQFDPYFNPNLSDTSERLVLSALTKEI